MKAITILQPYARLIACGAKKIETRGWATGYRGPIAIHAGKVSVNRVLKKMFPIASNGWTYHPDYLVMQKFINVVQEAMNIDNIHTFEFPLGAVIAIADLTHCLEINESHVYYLEQDLKEGRNKEILFGNFTLGRYAWVLENVKTIEPIPARGRQRLWEWEGDLK